MKCSGRSVSSCPSADSVIAAPADASYVGCGWRRGGWRRFGGGRCGRLQSSISRQHHLIFELDNDDVASSDRGYSVGCGCLAIQQTRFCSHEAFQTDLRYFCGRN